MVEQLNALQLPSSPIESFDADQNESRLEVKLMTVDLTYDLAELFSYMQSVTIALRRLNPTDGFAGPREEIAVENLAMLGFLIENICPIADAILDDAPAEVVVACTDFLVALEPYQMCEPRPMGSSGTSLRSAEEQARFRNLSDIVRDMRSKMSDYLRGRRLHGLN